MAKSGGGSGRGGGGGRASSPDAIAARLTALGGNRWTKGSEDRIYFDRETIAELGGLRTQRYRSGNISSATLRGDSISNRAARDLIESMPKTAYYDLARNTLVLRDGSLRGATSQQFQSRVRAAVAARR